MIFNMFEIFTAIVILVGGVFLTKKIKNHKKELKEGKKQKLLIEAQENKRCPICNQLGTGVYDSNTKSWYHVECYRNFFHN